MSQIRIGTSGWSYPAGKGTWNGIFYPAPRPRGFDELRYYAEHFDTVEVNSTFYRMPEAPQTRAWLERTGPDFLFSIKLYQKFTHPDMYLARAGVTDWDLSRADIDLFRMGVDPIAEAGRLGAVLIQFPASFHAGPEARDYLDWLLEGLSGYPLVVELRHRTWSDDTPDTQARLDARGATWALIDEPKFRDSIQQPSSIQGQIAAPNYIRLHGRNAAAWWTPEKSEDRYDYLYSAAELQPIAQAATRAATPGRRVLMYLNNHFSAKAVANAAVLKNQVGQELPGDYPRAMVDRYPELAGLVATSGLPL